MSQNLGPGTVLLTSMKSATFIRSEVNGLEGDGITRRAVTERDLT